MHQEMSSSSSSSVTMETNKDHPLMAARVVIAYDATKDRTEMEFRHTINNIRSQGYILHEGDTLMVLGVLHKVHHPSKYLDINILSYSILFSFDFMFAVFSMCAFESFS